MAFTTKQIKDLNKSMSSAKAVSLGTLLSALDSAQVASGSVVPTSATHTIVTGLSTITAATVALSGSPTENHMWSTIASGSVAGTIVISSYAPTNASTVTPIAATGSFVKVNWIAVGS